MNACPHCNGVLPEQFRGGDCPHCGQRIARRGRSLSGFSLPTAAAIQAGSSASSIPPPPRKDVDEDRWDVTDAPPSVPAPKQGSPLPPPPSLNPLRGPTSPAALWSPGGGSARPPADVDSALRPPPTGFGRPAPAVAPWSKDAIRSTALLGADKVQEAAAAAAKAKAVPQIKPQTQTMMGQAPTLAATPAVSGPKPMPSSAGRPATAPSKPVSVRPTHSTLAFGAGEVEALLAETQAAAAAQSERPSQAPTSVAHFSETTASDIRTTQPIDTRSIRGPTGPRAAPVEPRTAAQMQSLYGPPGKQTLVAQPTVSALAEEQPFQHFEDEPDDSVPVLDERNDPLPGASPLPLMRRRSDPGDLRPSMAPSLLTTETALAKPDPREVPTMDDLRSLPTLVDEAPIAVPATPMFTPPSVLSTGAIGRPISSPPPPPQPQPQPQPVRMPTTFPRVSMPPEAAMGATVTPTDSRRAQWVGGAAGAALLVAAGLGATSSMLHASVYGCAAVVLLALSVLPLRPSTRAVLMLVPALPSLAYATLATASLSRIGAALTTLLLGLVSAGLGWLLATPESDRWRGALYVGLGVGLVWLGLEGSVALGDGPRSLLVMCGLLVAALVAVTVTALRGRPATGLVLVSAWAFLLGSLQRMDGVSLLLALGQAVALAALPWVTGVNLGAVLSAYLEPSRRR